MYGTTVAYLLLAWLAARCVYRGYLHPLAKYPGPFLARFTNLWRFVAYLRRHGHLVDAELHGRYGPVVRTGPDSLSFGTLAAYSTIYSVDSVFEKGAFYDFGRDPWSGRGSLFTARTAADLRDARRKVLHGAFSAASVASYRPLIADAVSTFVHRIEEMPSDSVNVAPLIQSFVTDLNFRLIHGVSLDLPARSRAAALQDLQTISKFSFACAYLPLLNYILSSRLGMAALRRPTLDPVTKEPVGFAALLARSQEAVFRGSAPAAPSLLRSWLAVETDKAMDRPQIARECMNLVFAGRGSTAAAIVGVLHMLSTTEGQPWQRRIRDDFAQGQRSALPPAFLAVAKETLRLHPPFPRGFPREVRPTADVTMPGTARPLPPRTLVASSTYVIGRSTEVWGEDAADWKPERWLAAAGSDPASLERRFVVFGTGMRGCIGRDLAWTTIAESVRQVLARWEITADSPLRAATDWEVRYDACPLTFRPRDGVTSEADR